METATSMVAPHSSPGRDSLLKEADLSQFRRIIITCVHLSLVTYYVVRG